MFSNWWPPPFMTVITTGCGEHERKEREVLGRKKIKATSEKSTKALFPSDSRWLRSESAGEEMRQKIIL